MHPLCLLLLLVHAATAAGTQLACNISIGGEANALQAKADDAEAADDENEETVEEENHDEVTDLGTAAAEEDDTVCEEHTTAAADPDYSDFDSECET